MTQTSPFMLRVEFSGLFLFVHKSDEVIVLIPDGRNPRKYEKPQHLPGYQGDPPGSAYLDGTEAEPHVAYIKIPLEHLGVPVARAAKDEAILRLDRNQILIGQLDGDTGALNVALDSVPDFSVIGKNLDIDPQCYTNDPPATLVGRLSIKSGDLRLLRSSGSWTFSNQLWPPDRTTPSPHEKIDSNYTVKNLARVVRWTVPSITAQALDLELRGFGNTEPDSVLRLTPVMRDVPVEFEQHAESVGHRTQPFTPAAAAPSDQAEPGESNNPRVRTETRLAPVIDITIGNLCHSNPLEWEEIRHKYDHPDSGWQDHDFKWFYNLLEDHEAIRNRLNTLPLPIPTSLGGAGGHSSTCAPVRKS